MSAAEECVRRDSGSIDALISERRMSLTELADRWPEIAWVGRSRQGARAVVGSVV